MHKEFITLRAFSSAGSEHLPYKQRVGGSNPSTPTNKELQRCSSFFILKNMDDFYVYIIYSAKLDIYYVGSTGNLEDRLKRHNSGRSTFTKPGVPWELVYQKKFSTKSDACKFEYYVKSQKSRIFIESIIKGV